MTPQELPPTQVGFLLSEIEEMEIISHIKNPTTSKQTFKGRNEPCQD